MLGELLKEHRQRKKLKACEVAKAVGVHQSYVTQIERQNKKCSPEVIKRFYELFQDKRIITGFIKEKHPDILELFNITLGG